MFKYLLLLFFVCSCSSKKQSSDRTSETTIPASASQLPEANQPEKKDPIPLVGKESQNQKHLTSPLKDKRLISLLEASVRGKIEDIKQLLKIEAVKKNINAQNESEQTAFFNAAWYGHLEIMDLLLEAGADPVLPDKDGNTPLIRAAHSGKTAAVRRLLKIEAVRQNINAQNENGATAFFKAVNQGHQEIMDLLLEAGVDPTRPDKDGYSPLRRLISWGKTEAVKKLLKIEAVRQSINFPDKDGYTLLIRATYSGKTAAVKQLLKIETVRQNINAQNESEQTAFFNAAWYGHLEIMDLLLEAGADPVLPDKDGNTPLIRAAHSGKTAAVRRLLKIEAVRQNINAQNENGATAFFKAVNQGHQEIMDLLLEAGVDPTRPDKDGYSPLRRLISWGKTEAVKKLLKIEAVRQSINFPDKDGYTLLIRATYSGKTAAVKQLLKIEAVRQNINAQNESEQTAFFNAAWYGHLEIMDLLLEAGADPVLPDKDGNTPLIRAAHSGKTAAVRRLLKIEAVRQNINAQNENGATAFFKAVNQGHQEIMDLLLEAGADPILPDKDGYTPLRRLVSWGRTKAVKKLLKIEAVKKNINAQNESKETAFFNAAWYGHLEIMDLLLEAGADPILPDKNGNTPLIRAAHSGKTAAVRRLLKIEAVRQNINAQNENGATAFFKAVNQGHQEIMDLLLEAGADPILPDKDGYTPLRRLVSWGRTKAVKKLLKIEAVKKNINAQNESKETAFFNAAWYGHLEIMDLLLEAGADPILPDKNGNTPLIRAAHSGKTAAVRRLLKIEAVRQSINAQNEWGRTAFLRANEQGHQEIMDLLLEAGASSEIPQKSGQRTERKKSLQTKGENKDSTIAEKNRHQKTPSRDTAFVEKKKLSSREDSFWKNILSNLKKLFP